MPVSAGISALGSLGGAALGYFGSKNAANAQTQLGQQALGQQQAMFGAAQSALSPYIGAGQSVLPTLQKLLTPGADMTATLSKLPGFQFQSQWGNQATTNALAARGLAGSSGPLSKAISDYNNGLAGSSFGTLVSQLQGFAGMGVNAGSALAGNAISAGNGIANTLTGIGGAQAGGILGSTNALTSGLTGAAGSLGNAALLSKLLGGSTGLTGGAQPQFYSPQPTVDGGG